MRSKFILLIAALLGACSTMQLGAPNKNSQKEIEVTQTDRGAVITVSERILFDSGKFSVKKESYELIDKVAKVLIEKTKNQIIVEGHTDNVGSSELNNTLSEKRALSIKQELTTRGVQEKRVVIKGFGFSKPKTSNATEDGRRLNRRTEILVLGEKKENLGENLEDILGNVWLKVKQIFS